MKTMLSTIIFLVFQISSFAQISKTELCQNWMVKKGWFGDETMSLQILNKEKQNDMIELLKLNSNGSMTEELYNPQHIGMCGNGLLYFESATWRLENNSIVFDVKGGRMAESKFHYIMTYEITSLLYGKMVLKKTNVQLNEVKK